MARIELEKLHDSNYATWAVAMEALLVTKGLWDVVEGEPKPTASTAAKVAAWDAKNRQARAEIILQIDPSQYAHIQSEKDAAEVWATLKMVHQSRGFATRMSLRRKFLTMTKDPRTSMSSWIAIVRGLAFELEKIEDEYHGLKVTTTDDAKLINRQTRDEDVILVLTMGLPKEYDHFVTTLDATPRNDLTLEYVVGRLLNEESRQLSAHPEKPAGAAFIAAKTPRPIEEITCFNCGAKGHYQANCPKTPNPARNVTVTGGRSTSVPNSNVTAASAVCFEDTW